MKTVLIRLIQFYQKYLSPMKRTKCPYFPSCSQYGLEAIQKYGALKGGPPGCLEDFKMQSVFQWWI